MSIKKDSIIKILKEQRETANRIIRDKDLIIKVLNQDNIKLRKSVTELEETLTDLYKDKV